MTTTGLALSSAVAPPAARPAPPPRPAVRPVDPAAVVDELHRRHGAELQRFCTWMLRDPHEAADAVQDTWIKAMTALGNERVWVATLRPWLYAIARNACLDRLRERKRSAPHEVDEEQLGEGPAADEVAGMRNEARRALALVAGLTPRQRTALLMRDVAGLPISEVATALGTTPERAAWTVDDARRAVAETRGGTTMECADARDRLARGTRGRALRAHLAECSACRGHERSLRAKRVLAPALFPLAWLRRAWAGAALHSTAVALVAAGGIAVPLTAARHDAPPVRVAPGHPASALATPAEDPRTAVEVPRTAPPARSASRAGVRGPTGPRPAGEPAPQTAAPEAASPAGTAAEPKTPVRGATAAVAPLAARTRAAVDRVAALGRETTARVTATARETTARVTAAVRPPRPVAADAQQAVERVTTAVVAPAVDRAAAALDRQLGRGL